MRCRIADTWSQLIVQIDVSIWFLQAALNEPRLCQLESELMQNIETMLTPEVHDSDDVDLALLDKLTSVSWPTIKKAADLACGTGRTGLWLKQKGIEQIDGLDITHEMLELAARKHVYNRLVYGDMRTSLLGSGSYELVTNVLGNEQIPDIEPLYKEVSRILKPGGYYIAVGYHPFYLLRKQSTNFIHLFSDHFRAAVQNQFSLIESDEKTIESKSPISYVLVWKKLQLFS